MHITCPYCHKGFFVAWGNTATNPGPFYITWDQYSETAADSMWV